MRASFSGGAQAGLLALLASSAALGQGADATPPGSRAFPAETTAAAVTDPDWRPPRTSWGDPDLQGVWTTDDMLSVPRERPVAFGERASLTEAEFAERAAADERARDRVVNEQTFRRAERGVRTFGYSSLIVEPADGRMPALTEEAQQREAARRTVGTTAGGPFYTVEDFNLFERCITRGPLGSWGPAPYGNGAIITQSPDAVAISYEMVHDTRIIPLDGRAPLDPDIETWMGVPRGHWEGDTLVVVTTNFRPDAPVVGPIHSDAITLTERFTRIDPEMIDYQIRVEDPGTFVAPYTMRLTVTAQPGYRIYEYNCHEGNYSLPNTLSGERDWERRAAAAEAAGLPIPPRMDEGDVHAPPAEGVEVTSFGVE